MTEQHFIAQSSSLLPLHCLNVTWMQSTLVISNSKGLSEILRDIRTSTYQICRSEEKIIRTTTFNRDKIFTSRSAVIQDKRGRDNESQLYIVEMDVKHEIKHFLKERIKYFSLCSLWAHFFPLGKVSNTCDRTSCQQKLSPFAKWQQTRSGISICLNHYQSLG